MHLPAWKPDLIILNSGGSGNYKQRAGDSAAAGGREGGKEGREEGRREGGRYGLSHCVDVWCENSICSSPVIVTQFPLSHTHAHKLGATLAAI